MSKADSSRCLSLSLIKRLAPEASKMFSRNECSYPGGEEEDSKLDCQAILAVEGSSFLLQVLPPSSLLPFSVFHVPVRLLVKYAKRSLQCDLDSIRLAWSSGAAISTTEIRVPLAQPVNQQSPGSLLGLPYGDEG